MPRQPISPQPVAFIYPTSRGLFASDLLADNGEKARVGVTNPTLRLVAQGVFRSLRGTRNIPDLANVVAVAKLIADPYGVDVIHLPANRDMTARIMLRKRQSGT